jgi:hypothetical protein
VISATGLLHRYGSHGALPRILCICWISPIQVQWGTKPIEIPLYTISVWVASIQREAMTISILVETSQLGFRVTAGGPLGLSAEAASAAEAVNALQEMIAGRLE